MREECYLAQNSYLHFKLLIYYTKLAGYDERKSSVCVICMKYRIIILIIIIIILGQILLSYIANTSRTHAHLHPSPFRLSLFDGRSTMTGLTPLLAGSAGDQSECFIQINSRAGDSVFAIVLGIFRI